jgi:hypothetical protein|tara:strand:+ start:1788 stop:2078 length:291 start_codon:yes stop_codon:yes gene_type:complete
MLRLSVSEFYDMIPRQFFNMLEGYQEVRNNQEQSDWQRIRWQTTLLINIQLERGKRIKPTDLIQFDWEKEEKEIDLKKLKERAEYMKKLNDFKNGK